MPSLLGHGYWSRFIKFDQRLHNSLHIKDIVGRLQISAANSVTPLTVFSDKNAILMFPVGYERTYFFISGILGVIDPRKKFGHESSSKVGMFKMQIRELHFYPRMPFLYYSLSIPISPLLYSYAPPFPNSPNNKVIR